jgi:hypothetical protein
MCRLSLIEASSDGEGVANTSHLSRAKHISFRLELNQQPWDITEALL